MKEREGKQSRQSNREEIKVAQKHRQSVLWRSNGTIGFAKIKKGLYSLLVHSGPHALRKRSDKRDMTSLESPNTDIRQLKGPD